MMQSVRHYLTELTEHFGRAWNCFWLAPSDPYPLCVIRLLTGLVAVYWLLTYTPDLDRYFASDGWLPVDSVRQLELTAEGKSLDEPLYQPSYLDFISSPDELLAAHAVGVAVLVLFAAGVLTRITSVLALVVVLSYVHRASMLTSQFEPILTMVLFYLCVGPAGACLSVDRWRARRKAAQQHVAVPSLGQITQSTSATVATRLIQVHLAMIYGLMGLSQLMSDTWWSGLGAWWLIARPESRLADLTFLHQYPFLVEAWSHAIVAFELAMALLVWNRLARPLLLALAVPMLVGLAVITGQTTFAMMMLIANLAYCSPAWLKSWCISVRPPASAGG